MHNNSRDKKLRYFINSNMKQTIQEGTFSSFKDFIKKKRTEYEQGSVMNRIIDRALKMNSDQDAEEYINSIIRDTENSKPFDRIKKISGLENILATIANTQAKTLTDKWNSSKAFLNFKNLAFYFCNLSLLSWQL